MNWLDNILNGPRGGVILLALLLGFWLTVLGLIVALTLYS